MRMAMAGLPASTGSEVGSGPLQLAQALDADVVELDADP